MSANVINFDENHFGENGVRLHIAYIFSLVQKVFNAFGFLTIYTYILYKKQFTVLMMEGYLRSFPLFSQEP